VRSEQARQAYDPAPLAVTLFPFWPSLLYYT
jgi:hypothetical protein